MSVEATSGPGKLNPPQPSPSDDAKAVLQAARQLNARKQPDPYLVYDLLGETYDEAKAVYRKMWTHLHPDRIKDLPLTPAEREEVEKAAARLSGAWDPIKKAKVLPSRQRVELAQPATSFTEDVIMAAGTFADSSLRVARETATDLFEAGKSFLANWSQAIKRTDGNAPKSE